MDSNLISSVNGQHEPVDMPKFLQALKSGADHAVGTASSIQRSRKALETLDQDFDPSYGVETEINYQLRKTKTAEIPTTVKYHEASSKANPLLQGLNLF